MRTFLLTFTLFFGFLSLAEAQRATVTELNISSAMTDNRRILFNERSTALALNVEYDDVKMIRAKISGVLKKRLKFFDTWETEGEAHVTTITPPEFNNQLTPYVSQDTINRIAANLDIQASDVKVLGLGSGKKVFNGELGETFFIIIQSRKLLAIREAIYLEYLKNGGPKSGPKAFNPRRFFPHITVGFTHDDIHESDGLLKDVEHSLDRRFLLRVTGL